MWLSGKEFPCQCRRHGFDPWSGRIPHAPEQLSLCSRAPEPQLLKPTLHRTCAPQEEPSEWKAHALQLESSSCSPQPEKSPRSNEDPAERHWAWPRGATGSTPPWYWEPLGQRPVFFLDTGFRCVLCHCFRASYVSDAILSPSLPCNRCSQGAGWERELPFMHLTCWRLCPRHSVLAAAAITDKGFILQHINSVQNS